MDRHSLKKNFVRGGSSHKSGKPTSNTTCVNQPSGKPTSNTTCVNQPSQTEPGHTYDIQSTWTYIAKFYPSHLYHCKCHPELLNVHCMPNKKEENVINTKESTSNFEQELGEETKEQLHQVWADLKNINKKGADLKMWKHKFLKHAKDKIAVDTYFQKAIQLHNQIKGKSTRAQQRIKGSDAIVIDQSNFVVVPFGTITEVLQAVEAKLETETEAGEEMEKLETETEVGEVMEAEEKVAHAGEEMETTEGKEGEEMEDEKEQGMKKKKLTRRQRIRRREREQAEKQLGKLSI